MKRILSFILCFCLFISIFISQCSFSYALPKRLLDGTWIDVPVSEYGQELSLFLQYAVNQIGAWADGNFESWLKNNETYSDLYDDNGRLANSVSVDEESNKITISADLVSLIKQALKEYSEETNGFYLLPTTDYDDMSPSMFYSYNQYCTFRNIIKEKGVLAVSYVPSKMSVSFPTMYFFDPAFSDEEPYAFIAQSTSIDNIKTDPFYFVRTNVYGAHSWAEHKAQVYKFDDFYTYDKQYTSCSEATEMTGSNSKRSDCYVNYNPVYWPSYNTSFYTLYSTTGERVKVFVSLNALKNYTAGKRSVYFGKDFYNTAPSDITATWDDMANTIDHIDDVLSELLDKITDDTDESEIEDLLQQILDELKNGNQGGNEGGGNQGGSTGNGGSYDDSGLLATLGGYFSDVLMYLEDISQSVKGLVWIEADKELDKDKTDLLDLIDRIWKDPETGSQEAADTLSGSFAEIAGGITKKFPFSIPWDIYALFTVFSGTPPPDTAAYRTVTFGVKPFTVDNEDLEQDMHEAPYFVLPLRIDSWRIYEEAVIDLKDFKPVSTLSRGLLAVLFAVFLIKFTIRIIELFKGGTDD